MVLVKGPTCDLGPRWLRRGCCLLPSEGAQGGRPGSARCAPAMPQREHVMSASRMPTSTALPAALHLRRA